MAEEKGKKMIGSYDIKVPEDTDVTLGYDITANKVKNFKFSGIWTWIVSKLKGESISDLNTTNKTVVGAIKEVNNPTFTTATSRTNINSGESQSIIMGKLKKWLADLGTAAFCSVVNNLTTTAEGSVLDARQGKNLSDALTKLNTLMGNTDISAIGGGTLTGAINELNSKAQIDTSVIYYPDSEYEALGGLDACVKDAVTKNRFPKEGTFFKSFIAGSRHLAVGYRYVNGTYGLIVLYRYGLKLDSRYSIESGIFSKIS